MEKILEVVAIIAFVIFIIYNVFEIILAHKFYKKIEKEHKDFIDKLINDIIEDLEKNGKSFELTIDDLLGGKKDDKERNISKDKEG